LKVCNNAPVKNKTKKKKEVVADLIEVVKQEKERRSDFDVFYWWRQISSRLKHLLNMRLQAKSLYLHGHVLGI
jgi:hypothetical protein